MMIELEAFSGDLATMVFVAGSAVMLIASMLAMAWLSGPEQSGIALHAPLRVKSYS